MGLGGTVSFLPSPVKKEPCPRNLGELSGASEPLRTKGELSSSSPVGHTSLSLGEAKQKEPSKVVFGLYWIGAETEAAREHVWSNICRICWVWYRLWAVWPKNPLMPADKGVIGMSWFWCVHSSSPKNVVTWKMVSHWSLISLWHVCTDEVMYKYQKYVFKLCIRLRWKIGFPSDRR